MSRIRHIFLPDYQLNWNAAAFRLLIAILMVLSFTLNSRAEDFRQILSYYMNKAVENNPGLMAKKQTLKAATARVSQARSEMLPSVEFSSRYTRAGGGREFIFDLNPFNIPMVIRENFMREREHETKFTLIQPLFAGGSIYYNYRTNKYLKKSTEYQYQGETDNLKLETAEAYITCISAVENVKAVEKSVERAEELLRISRVKFRTQTGVAVDTLRAQAELSTAKSQLTTARNNANLSASQLTKLSGVQSEKIKMPEESPAPQEVIIPSEDISRYETMAKTQRPEVKQLSEAIESTKSAEKTMRGVFLPAVVLAADYGWQGKDYNLNNDYDMWMVSGVLKWNLFNGFGDKSRLSEAKIKSRELELLRNDLVADLQLNARAAALEYENAYNEWTSLKANLSAAEENYRIRKVLYETGSGTILEMLDAAELLQKTSSGEIVSRYRTILAQIKLNWAAGNDLLNLNIN